MAVRPGDGGGGAVNSVPQHLLSEDRQEYERLLDEALRSAPHRPELAAAARRLNPEQLRTMALNATALITAAAATEYQYYLKVREEMHDPAYRSAGRASTASSSAPSRSARRPAAPGRPGPAGPGRRIGGAVPSAGPSSGRRVDGVAAQQWARMSYGRRLLAVVLGLHVRPEAPAGGATDSRRVDQTSREASESGALSFYALPAAVLSATVTAIFLLAGFTLTLFNAASKAARPVITAGLVSGAVAAGALVLVLAIARRRPSSLDDGSYGEIGEKVGRAREAWRTALLERGILPFLREALADPDRAAALLSAPPAPTSRMPHLGYDRPGFSRPDGGAPGPRPSFTSPDYSSPDFGGPDHQPE
ncbi:hypothetical protein [Streptomyces massasporeus]|uniref:hypothetical protein n=1 Tax=Streptomyces massasporeus TaxID=67324 RepID=UPI0037FC20B5